MTVSAPPALGLAEDKRQSARPASIWRDTLGNLLRQRNAVFGGAILLFFVFVAVFADQIATHDPTGVLIGVGIGRELGGDLIESDEEVIDGAYGGRGIRH